jgi:excisionase family DNA binding protein
MSDLSVSFSEGFVEQLAARVAALLSVEHPWLTTEEAAAYCRMTPAAIRSAEKRKQLRGYRGETGRLRFRREDLDRFLGDLTA